MSTASMFLSWGWKYGSVETSPIEPRRIDASGRLAPPDILHDIRYYSSPEDADAALQLTNQRCYGYEHHNVVYFA